MAPSSRASADQIFSRVPETIMLSRLAVWPFATGSTMSRVKQIHCMPNSTYTPSTHVSKAAPEAYEKVGVLKRGRIPHSHCGTLSKVPKGIWQVWLSTGEISRRT